MLQRKLKLSHNIPSILQICFFFNLSGFNFLTAKFVLSTFIKTHILEHKETWWCQDKTLDSHSEGFEFDLKSNLCMDHSAGADFSAHR